VLLKGDYKERGSGDFRPSDSAVLYQPGLCGEDNAEPCEIPGVELLFTAETKYHASRIPDVVLMAAETRCAVDPSQKVLDLSRLDRDVIGEPVVQAAANRHGEAVLCFAIVLTAPKMRATEKSLHIWREARKTEVIPWAEHVREQPVAFTGIGVTTEVRDQTPISVQVVLEISSPPFPVRWLSF
jgi:hypothetical protein